RLARARRRERRRQRQARAMTEPFGPQAGAIESFWWFAFWMLATVYVVVMAALAFAVWRRGGKEVSERRLGVLVGGATVGTVILLFVFLAADLATARTIGRMPHDGALSIVVTGHQWWW